MRFCHRTGFDVCQRGTQVLHCRHRLLRAIGYRTELVAQRWRRDSWEAVECHKRTVHFSASRREWKQRSFVLVKDWGEFGVDALTERGNEGAIRLSAVAQLRR